MPIPWTQNLTPGVEWLSSLRARHPQLIITLPELCSLAIAIAFNSSNITKFLIIYIIFIKGMYFFANGIRVFNLHETSTTTVRMPQNVLAPKGIKCLSK